MQRGRKIASVIMLVVFATSNLFESFSYVFAQEENFETENQITVSETSDEGNNSDGDTAEDISSDDEAVNNETADDETENGAIVEPISSTIAGETLPTPETGNNETLPTPETGNNETLPTPETGSNETLPTPETGNNETLPTPETGNNETLPTPETGNNETLPTPETGGNETLPTPETGSVIDDEMDIYDLVYTGVVEGKRYTVTLMDRNLGAESNDMYGEESYGRYYQWGNNYPFSHHTQLNHYTNERVDASGYGPNNRFRGENFIKGSNDWSTVSNDNLWGGEGDNEENDYYDIDADRQGPCPDGYHVPSVGEWYALLSSFLANNGLDLASTSGLSYSDYIGKERKAAYYLDSEYIENFKEIFNISYAGRIIGNGNLQRTGETAHLWTSTPLNGESLGFEVWDDHINLGGWETVRTTGYPIRCFKSVEYELIDYTITYVDEGEVTTETKHWGDILTEPEHTEKGTGYNRLGWYSRGLKFNFETPVTGDLTLVSTWGCAEGYHLTGGQCESNIKVVDCIQTGGVENSKYIVTGSTITWDITGAKREEIPVCEWTCLDNYHLTGTQLTGGQLTGVKCESNTKIVDCIQTGKVENSTYILSGVEITWDITGAKRNETPACEWVCNQHYHLNGDECVIDTFQFTLQENVNVDTSLSTQTGKKPYNSRVELNAMVNTGYRFMGWQILGLEGSGSSSTTIDSQVVFNMPDREVVATPLSEIIEYKIVYKNVDDAVVENPTTYTIETDTFTLNDPIRTGYTFLGWTGSNGLDPEKNIIITKGNYGNKKYSAVWQANTGVKYEVVHALEKANTTSYEEVDTEILSGTTDEMTEAVAREYTGFTAKEIEQRVIRGDGSTVVRIMYDRNIYTITFDTDGGSEILPMTGKYGSNLSAPSDPTKGGYIFNGWSPVFPTTMPLGGAELLAQWRRRSGGGSSSSEEIQVTTGTNETTTGQTNTGKVEEVVNEVENLDVDAGTSIAPMVMRSMKLGSMMLMSVGPEIKATNTIECDSGYVLNQDGTGCELIQVTFDANGGEFEGGGTTEIVEPNLIEIYNKIYKYSHTQNVNDNGVQQSDYDEDWGNSNIRGTNRTSASSQAHVLTFPGVSSLTVDLYYNGESVSYDWVSVWKGSYPSYTASSNRTSAGYVTTADGAPNNNNKFGGSQNGTFTVNGNTLTKMGHSTLIIPGNAVTFGFTSDDDGCGYGYGYYAVVAGESNTVAGYQCGYDITAPTREGYFFDGWYTDTGYTHIFDTSASECLSGNTTIYAKRYQPQPKDIILEATATEANQTLKISKYFANGYKVYRGDGESENLTSDTTHTYSKAGTYTIILSLTGGADRWTFQNGSRPLVPTNGTSMTGVKIVSMPSLEDGFGNSATNPGGYFFSYFNYQGALTRLPVGSFDTSKITSVGSNFFYYFNSQGALTSLPDDSFDTSNITTVGNGFFGYFNSKGALTSLPDNSFDTSKITSVGNDFFYIFNYSGALTSLPSGSFDTSNITTVGNNFFGYFNYSGALTSLPDNSFDTSKITSVGSYFFSNFNSQGALTSLPSGSFDTSKITSAENYFFLNFNSQGALTSLPDDSFDTSNITTVGYYFFSAFNSQGALTSLPDNSFDTSNITTVGGNGFFSSFNYSGALTSLPDNSFDTSKITSVGNEFFSSFNSIGGLTSLPSGSFDTSNITTVGNNFFKSFNHGGALTSLPSGSFDTSNITSVGDYFFYYFNLNGALTSLPDGSFDTSNITSVGRDFFSAFNYGGQLISLPSGSFRFSTGLTSVGSYFFNSFNYSGALTSLPSGSFDTSKITSVKDYFFYRFNKNGQITNLPDSFTMNSAGASNYIGYQDAFNSPNYTLNRNVSDLVSGITPPSSDRNTFSDNQPGRCGVADNWLVNAATECLTITFDTNGGSPNFGIIIDPGFTIALPTATKAGHILSGWYTEQTGGTLVGVIGEIYTGISNTTLYAHWKACNSGFIPNADSTACICSPGSVLNTDGTGCVSVQITFDANGGIFSGGETEKVENTIFVELPSVRYSHTPNIDDEGNSNGNYGDNLEMLDVIKFTGSESLYVDLKYATETSYDYLVVLEGEYSGGEPNMPYHVFEGNSSYTLNTTGFYVDGDTVTFLFYSNGGGAYGGAYYGYYAIVEGIGASSENYRCEYDIIDPTREGYIFEGWYIDTGYTQIFDTSECLSSNTTVYAKWYQIHPKDIILEATATEPGQTLAMNKYFANAYTVYRGDKEVEDIVSDATYYYTAPDAMHTYSKAGTYTIILSLTGGADRWTFRNVGKPLVPINRTTMTGVKIVSMPSLADGFGESTTAPGNYFFYNFNHGGALTSLPEGSFDTSNITTVGDSFFGFFNDNGALTSLGSGSFRLSTGLTTVGNYFFNNFNYNGALTSLPEGSFRLASGLTTVGDYFFNNFNYNGALTSLPGGSFRLASGLTTVGDYFFNNFNYSGALESLPEGSFNTENITTAGNSFFRAFNYNGALISLGSGSFRLSTGLTTVGDAFFYSFNSYGALTSLPEGSFNTENITTVGDYFFENFNVGGSLTSLPEGSFDTSNITTAGNSFFLGFNDGGGSLTSLPEGSFRLSTGLTTVGDAFFYYFNDRGLLTSLPEGSFDTSNITSVGRDFFREFNYHGALESLPEGSFDTSNITSVGDYFFRAFNYGGSLISLPDSFKLNSVAYNKSSAYSNAFNSPSYTLNRNVSDIVSGVTVPSSDRNTFSDNQPGRCGVNANWLVNAATGCNATITFDTNGGDPVSSMVTNGKIILPEATKSGYILKGWYEGGTMVGKAGDLYTGNSSITLNAEWHSNKDIVLEATATAAGQTLTINKYFSNTYTVDRGDESPVETVSADKTHTYSAAGTYTITLSLTGSATRWKFKSYYYPLVPKAGTTMTGVKIVFMPSLADGFGNGAAIPGDYFFYNFNSKGAITSLPEGSFVTSNVTTAGVVFFSNFNSNGLLTSLPEGSFDTSNITTVTSNYFFSSFNSNGLLTSLPEGSFDTSNITYIGGDYFFSSFNYNGSLIGLPEGSFKFSTGLTTGSNYFFSSFNSNGLLTSLPTGSFNTENITIVRGDFFSKFNSGGLLTSLPTGSFITNNITIAGNSFFEGFNNNGLLTSLPTGSFKFSTGLTTAGINFFRNFNSKGGLVSLPDGSFNTENIASVGISFFQDFNNSGSLTSLPEGSFKFSTGLTNSKGGFFQAFNSKGALIGLPAGSFNMENITIAGNNFFYNFNDYGQLTSLPTGSFITSNITTGGDYFFSSFNSNGKITSLPEGSFDTSNITTVGNYFFSSFNNNGQLTSLPDGSFNLSKITTVGNYFFSNFNSYGKITSLPEGSFDTSNITTVGNYFFYYFNNNGQLTELPDSFKLTSAAYNKSYGYQNAFNSSNYTFNKKVLDLVKGITVPSNDRNTFSDNQPGRCGVHPNWLQTTANACSITYDDGQGGTGQLKYDANTMSVAVGSGIIPARTGYMFLGWTNASGETINHVTFPEMDGQTIYAQWTEVYTITYNLNGGEENWVNPTSYTALSGTFGLYQPTKTGAMFLGWTGSNGDEPNANIYITQGSTGNRIYNTVWGTYEDIDAYFISNTGAVSYITLMDRNMGASVAGTGENSYGFHYQWGNNYGFASTGNILTGTTEAIRDSNYNNNGYNGYIFIMGRSIDYWTGESYYDGLWGGSGDNVSNNWGEYTMTSSNIINRQGPCPGGYHVPSIGEWNKLLYLRASNLGYNIILTDSLGSINSGSVGTNIGNDLLLPLAGSRNLADPPAGVVSNTGYYAHYWSSSPREDSLNAYKFLFNANRILANFSYFRADGYSVRCFSNDYMFTQPSMTIHPNGGTGAMILVEGNNIKSLGTPSRNDGHSIFEGWYDASNGGNQVQTGDTAPANLYAKWSCDSFEYKDNGTECAINKDIILEATTTSTGKTIAINKYFSNAYTVDWGDGNPVETVSANKTHTYTGDGTYSITLSLSGADRWTFYQNNTLVPQSGTSMTGVKITYMPSLADGFGADATNVGDDFFRSFNRNGAITSLPNGSFDISNITTVGTYFFLAFNENGLLKNLPDGSFRLSTGLKTVGTHFFAQFNYSGLLTSLPDDSFNTENITDVGDSFFLYFNTKGAITGLPDGSFNTENITTVGSHFFRGFNDQGALTSLSTGSFRLSTGLKTVGTYFFAGFNDYGAITSLPDGSFNTENITTVGTYFFAGFNDYGAITSLPDGSFDTSNIITAGNGLFQAFNLNGAITYLPDSFKLTSAAYNKTNGYQNAFNSTGYTINTKVSDLVAGITPPSTDMDTFSDNQPGRCGVHPNWLVTTADACSISYDDGKGGTGEFKYTADTTGVEVGSGITLPTVEGYIFGGWYTASGDRVDEVSFPEMDGQTLYARWVDNVEPISSITTTNALKTGSQIATLSCSDNVGVTKYYWGTGTNPADSAYTAITGTTNFSTGKTVTAAGTYYLYCKDAAGNVSTGISQTYNSYKINDMRLTAGGTADTYTTANYGQTSTNTYIAPSGTVLDISSIYTVPTYSNPNRYRGFSTGAASTTAATIDTGSTSVVLNSNVTYSIWFSRNVITFRYVARPGETLTATTKSKDGTTTYTRTRDVNNYVMRSANGGDPVMQTSSVRFGAAIDLANYDNGNYLNIKKTGYVGVTQKEWICITGCTTLGQTYRDDTNVTMNATNTCPTITTEDCTIDIGVNWTNATYKVTLNNNGATTAGTASVNATYDKSTLSPATITLPIRQYVVSYDMGDTGLPQPDSQTGVYTLLGWYTAKSGGSKVINESTTPVLQPSISSYTNASGNWIKAGAATLYAHWSNTSASITLPTLQKDGYACKWAKSSTGGAQTSGGVSVIPTANTTYFAVCVDNVLPSCTISAQPTKTLLREGETGSVAFTCISTGAEISTETLTSGAIAYTDSIVILGDADVTDTTDGKIYTYIYTANAEGTTTFSLKTGQVSDAAGNTNAVTDATNIVIVDNTAPILSADKAGIRRNDDITITLSVSDTNGLNYAKYSRTSEANCVSSGTSFVSGDTLSFTTEGTGTLYLCAEDILGNTSTWSGEYKIDRVRPAITFDQQSGAAAHSHSVEITASDVLSKLVGGGDAQSSGGDERNTATYSLGVDGYTVTYDGKSYTLAYSDLPGTYYRGNNIAGDSTTYNGGGNNNRWGGGGDTSSNGYDSGNPRSERQGPCQSGWHVPSRGEWKDIITARCYLDSNSCTPSDINYWGEIINNSTLALAFKTSFGMTNGRYWSSTPDVSNSNYAWIFLVSDDSIDPGNDYNHNGSYIRGSYNNVRCLKDSTPSALNYRWQTGSTCSSDESDYISTSRDSYTNDGTATSTVTTSGLADGSYYLCVLSGSISDAAGNVNVTTKTSGQFVVDNTNPTCTITQAACTSGALLLTLTGSEALQTPTGWTKTSDTVYTMGVTSNNVVNVTVTDLAGNTGSCSITVTNYDVTGPDAPVLGYPDPQEVRDCIMGGGDCPQYDFNGDGVVNIRDVVAMGIVTNNNEYIIYNGDVTNNSKPKFVWLMSADIGCSSVAGYQIQICNDNACNIVVNSGSSTDAVRSGEAAVSDGTYYWRVKAVDGLGNRGEWSDIWSFTVDTNSPILSANNSDERHSSDISITLSASDTNGLNYAKYSRTSAANCVSSGTSFASGDTTTYNTEGTGTLYLCVGDLAGNTATWSGVYYLDKTRPAITFDQQSGAAAHSHSVEITATDTGSKLVGGDAQPSGGDDWNTATFSSGVDGYTVTYNGKSYTLAYSDLPGTYKRGNNIAGNSTTYNGVQNNNRWGGSGDNASNGFNPNPTNFDERQGPCATGWHVPSRGERNNLVIAWCHLDSNSCTSGDLKHASDWTASNNMIRIYKSGLGKKFKSDFSVSDDYLWSSSPSLDNINVAWSFDLDDGIYPNNGYDRDDDYLVRCFKNSTSETTTLNYRWQTDSTCSSDESDYTSTSRDSYDETNTTATATVTTSGLDDGSYYLCVLSGSISDNAGNTNITTRTQGTFIVDNAVPTCNITQSPVSGTWTNGNVTLTATVTDANPDKYSWTGWNNMTTNLTTWVITSNGDKTFYVQDAAGNTGSCSITISNIDKVVPTSSITTTNTLKTGSQTATLSCSDNVGVTKYYRGTTANPADNAYTSVASTISFSTTKTVDAAGTYNLYCKDAAGNVSTAASQTYYSYEVHNMLNAVDKAEGTYNATNYPQSSTYTYIAPSSTTITFADVYTVPTYSAVNQYKGWSASASTATPSTSASDTLNGNKTYYFWFDRTKYNLTLTKNTGIETIYYKVNGASDWSSTTSSTTVQMKAGSNASAYAVASNCYTCANTCKSSGTPQTWNTVTAAQTYSPTATENTNNITYNLNGGTNNANNPATYKITQLPITLQQPTKTGYTFQGWTGNNGSTPQTNVTIAAGSCGAKTYNANWQANTYNISYILSGGAYGNSHPTTATYDTAFTVSNPTKTGYTFKGWKITGMNAGVTHTYGSNTTTSTTISSTKETTFENLHSTNGATVTFEALWTVNQYNVTISVSPEGWGTYNGDPTEELYYGDLIKLSNNAISFCYGSDGPTIRPPSPFAPYQDEDGNKCWDAGSATSATATQQYTYTFSGWNNECGDTVTHDCTITAEFTRTVNNYNVTFNSNGGTPTPATQSIAYGSKATRPADPTRTGYTFGGWTLNGNDFDFDTTITGAITLVAKWNIVEYTITYNLDGGTNNTNNPSRYTVESGAITLQQPTKTGYTFQGWTGSNGSIPQTGVIIPSGSTGNRIYNATWQANTNTPYTVYHYVKKVGSGTYELAQTEPKQGTSDAILTLSSLAKADGFVCATYDRGSLTGTENGPGEIVTQTTINGDGSTKIYLYYTRNNRTVHLSGDEHVDYLEIDGVVDDEAVRECGSEVPVNAIPKPGYHFVRWRERERTEEEEEEKNG